MCVCVFFKTPKHILHITHSVPETTDAKSQIGLLLLEVIRLIIFMQPPRTP